MNTFENPYGLREGVLVTADQVESGLSCNCFCPACGKKLQAHKGTKKRAYFAHYRGSDYGYGLETATHLMAKEIIETEKVILLPAHEAHPNWKELEYIRKEYPDLGYFPENLIKKVIVKPWIKVKLDSVNLENKIGRIIPDIVVTAHDRVLYIEIKVTHGIDDSKLKYIQENNLNVIEYDFSKMAHTINKNHLLKVLTETYKGAKAGYGRAAWINHKDTLKFKYELTDNLRKLYPPKPPWELKKKT